MRVIGSQDISLTMTFCSSGASRRSPCSSSPLRTRLKVASGRLVAASGASGRGLRHSGSLSYLFLMVRCAEVAQQRAVGEARRRREEPLAVRSSSMNGMYLSGKPGIVQAMQMPPTFGQPPMPFTQPRSGTLHFTTGPLQPSLTRQRWSEPYSRGEVAVLVEGGAVAALVRRAPEEPLRPQLRRRARSSAPCRRAAARGRAASRWCCRAARGSPGCRRSGGPPSSFQLPAEVVRQAHGAGRVVLHRRDAAVGGAGAERDHGRGLGGEAVDPLVGGDRLAGGGIDAHRRPSGPRR